MYITHATSLGYGRGGTAHAVLDNVSLTINTGERVALLGKSGSGKSTLLAHLRQLQPAQSAWCPQHPALVPQLSVFHNIYTGALNRHNALINVKNFCWPCATTRREITHLTDHLALSDSLWRKAGELSGGQQQRVGMGRALYQRRPALLADEPVSALDLDQGRALLSWLLDQHQTSVIALHQVELALGLCDRIIGLADHRILFDAPSQALQASDLACLYR